MYQQIKQLNKQGKWRLRRSVRRILTLIERNMNMHVDDLAKSKYFGKVDCREPVWLTITRNGKEMIKQQSGPDEEEEVLYFHENPKPLILKKTNANLIASFTGIPYTEKWKGVRVQMWVDPTVDYGGKIVGGVRVKQAMNPNPQGSQQQAPPPSTYQPPPEFEPTPPQAPPQAPPVTRVPGQDDEFDRAMAAEEKPW